MATAEYRRGHGTHYLEQLLGTASPARDGLLSVAGGCRLPAGQVGLNWNRIGTQPTDRDCAAGVLDQRCLFNRLVSFLPR